MPMPLPSLHLDCFVQWAQSDGKQLYEGLRLVFGEEKELQWDSLIVSFILWALSDTCTLIGIQCMSSFSCATLQPQLIWRGTDFSYLTGLLPRDTLIRFLPN